MGIVQRQGIYNSVFNYLGIILGYVNVVLLFPHLMDADQFGLTRLLFAVLVIATQFAQLGLVTTTMKVFPWFRSDPHGHHGYLFNAFAILLMGIGITGTCLWLMSDLIAEHYQEKSALFTEYYYLIFPLLLFSAAFNVLDAYLKSLFKSSFQQFLIEVWVRILVTILLLAYGRYHFSFTTFMHLYIGAYALNFVLLVAYTIKIGQFRLKPDFAFLTPERRKEMVSYSLLTLVSSAAILLAGNIDIVLVGKYIGLEATAIFSVAFYIGAAMAVPAKAINMVVPSLIAEAWKANRMNDIAELYRKTAINNFILGLFLLLCVWVSIDDIFTFLPEKYASGKWVVLIIGLNRLIDMGTGVNGQIILASALYRFEMIFNIIYLVLIVITDMIFIPIYGIEGAAGATLAVNIVYNSLRFLLVRNKFGMQPFTPAFIWVAILGLLTPLILGVLPWTGFRVMDMIARGLSVGLLYLIPVYLICASLDLNQLVNRNIRKIYPRWKGVEKPIYVR